MNVRTQGGFTIIELMLFISISTLMTITLLVGWTVAINTQSYRDATRSLASTLQAEYNLTTNVLGERSAGYRCVRASQAVNVTQTVPASGASRGTTDCVFMGRYVVVNGANVSSTVVLGMEPTTPIPGGTSDQQVIRDYLPTRVDSALIPGTSNPISWISTTYKSSTDPTPVKTAFLIVRSPETGTTYTYNGDFTNSEPTARDLVLASRQTAKTICLDPGAPIAQPRAGVIVGANAASATSINTSTNVGVTGC